MIPCFRDTYIFYLRFLPPPISSTFFFSLRLFKTLPWGDDISWLWPQLANESTSFSLNVIFLLWSFSILIFPLDCAFQEVYIIKKIPNYWKDLLDVGTPGSRTLIVPGKVSDTKDLKKFSLWKNSIHARLCLLLKISPLERDSVWKQC